MANQTLSVIKDIGSGIDKTMSRYRAEQKGKKTANAYQQAMKSLGEGDRQGAINLADSKETVTLINNIVQNYDLKKEKTKEMNLKGSMEAGDLESALKYGMPDNSGNRRLMDFNLTRSVNEMDTELKKNSENQSARQMEATLAKKPASAPLLEPLIALGYVEEGVPLSMLDAGRYNNKYASQIALWRKNKTQASKQSFDERKQSFNERKQSFTERKTVDDLQKVTKNNLEKSILSNTELIKDIESLEKDYDPSFLTYEASAYKYFANIRSKVDPSYTNEGVSKQIAFKKKVDQLFIKYRKWATGVAGGKEEMKRIEDTYFSSKNSPLEFKAGIEEVKRFAKKHLSNSQKQLQTGNLSNSGSNDDETNQSRADELRRKQAGE